jgi:hypothetical protein
MSTRAEFAKELRSRFRAPSVYSDTQLLRAWDALMADGTVEAMDDTPYSGTRIFYEHLTEVVAGVSFPGRNSKKGTP